MKFLTVSLFICASALAQPAAKVVTFNRADTEHCKVVVIGGKPLLESTYDGTSVAIALPVNRGNGEFLIFVAVSRAASGAVQVDPKDIYGLYPDTAHSRFTFSDKGSETGWQAEGQTADPGFSASKAQIDPGSLRPGQVTAGGPPMGGSPPGAPGDGGPEGAPAQATYLKKSKVKQGDKMAGWIALRQAKEPRVEVHATDMLDEIDVPVNGVVFRF